MRKPDRPRLAGSNLIWVVGVAAGLIAGAAVAYGLATTTSAVAAPKR